MWFRLTCVVTSNQPIQSYQILISYRGTWSSTESLQWNVMETSQANNLQNSVLWTNKTLVSIPGSLENKTEFFSRNIFGQSHFSPPRNSKIDFQQLPWNAFVGPKPLNEKKTFFHLVLSHSNDINDLGNIVERMIVEWGCRNGQSSKWLSINVSFQTGRIYPSMLIVEPNWFF